MFKMDLLHILKTAISNGCYVHGNYNEKYIPGKWAYGNEDYMHDFLLIGCDDDTFISVGYVADGHFKKYTIPNQNLIESLYEVGGVKININLFSYEDGAVPSPNVQRMVNDLKKYISTSNCFENTNPSSNSYGIATNIRLKEFFLDEVKNKGEIYVDKRYSRVLLEHKWVMNQLVNLFLDAHEKVEFQKYTNQNYKKAEIVHMLGLKMSSNGQVDLINRIAQLIDEMIASELEYIPVLIRILEEKYQDADCKMKLQ